ncbi:unnamed protein product (macronuclear) [Paramecium tetraurelia]|uniref:Enoyl reductase (ER) domain-containing protein n=1 Tax=Paramecium tetraurelia TaxID=5888 RepID=A0CJM4_PARTE|nr:uncharacterized protein GSPATT00000703001 [Paramecium tetraurelia]CAK70991.1 unnamed protein product [Paramecium tetraurelia]|eukprot:XP_001438388.1 hypothetical protein (macronuclear) [Paramecium tetraurelia strain d4-2]
MQQFEIPKTFKAAQLAEYGKELQIAEIKTPELKEGEVLIKVEAAPVNPSDLSLNDGHYPSGKVLPAVPGIEGSGVVVQIGPNVENVKVGTKVAFTAYSNYGSYGQYSLTTSQQIIPLDDDISFEAGASSIVNPITVLLMLIETQELGAKAIVHTAASSALGRMLVKYFQDSGIDVINVVRRQEQVELLQKEGAKYVLNQTSETFQKDLNALAHKLNATVFFDCIGGNITGEILSQLPNKSTALLYGLLSGQPVSDISAISLIFQGKTIKGFWLTTLIHKYNPFVDENAKKNLNALLKTTLKTEYAKQYPLDKINEGIQFYKKNQTSGKILVRPHQ